MSGACVDNWWYRVCSSPSAQGGADPGPSAKWTSSEHFSKSAYQHSLPVETAYLEVSYSFLVSFFRNMRAALRKRVNWNITE
jgi:hypothetical protein